jgi:hypothetical protein
MVKHPKALPKENSRRTSLTLVGATPAAHRNVEGPGGQAEAGATGDAPRPDGRGSTEEATPGHRPEEPRNDLTLSIAQLDKAVKDAPKLDQKVVDGPSPPAIGRRFCIRPTCSPGDCESPRRTVSRRLGVNRAARGSSATGRTRRCAAPRKALPDQPAPADPPSSRSGPAE